MNRAKVISVMNWKGGVGKTTMTHHLGTGLHMLSKEERLEYLGSEKMPRVLFVDNDAQCNLSISCLHVEKYEDLVYKHNLLTIHDLYKLFICNESPVVDVNNYLIKNQVRMDNRRVFMGMDLLPAHQELVYLDMNIAMNSRASFQSGLISKEIYKYQYLNNILEPVRGDYDYIFIDCPPNLGYTTLNALYASEYCLIPTGLDHLSSYGIASLLKEIDRLNTEFATAVPDHPMIEVVGIVANNVEENREAPKRSQKLIRERLKDSYHELMFEPYLTRGDGIPNASEQGYPVYADRSGNALKQGDLLMDILREFLDRI
jgi:chromosome partitioning protein